MTSFLMTWRYLFHVFCNVDVFWSATGVPVWVTISTSTLIWRLAETTPEPTFVETNCILVKRAPFWFPLGGIGSQRVPFGPQFGSKSQPFWSCLKNFGANAGVSSTLIYMFLFIYCRVCFFIFSFVSGCQF